jgi:flagellar hook-associated protein 2
MASITFGGLASGLDTNSIIDKLMSIERQPIDRLQKQRQQETTRRTLIGDILTKMNSLSTAVLALNTQAAVQGRSVDVPQGAPFSATVQGAAPTGAYSIQVNALAQAQRTYSNAVANADTTGIFTAGTIAVTVGGTTANVNVNGADSLNTLATKLNATGLRLSAAVIYDGTNYRMVVNGADTGASNAITFSDPAGTGLGLDAPANTVVAAQNASVKIDGLTVTSSSNTVSGSIPGVTLTLKGTSGTASTLTVSQDPEKLKTALKGVVEAYNAVMSLVNKQFPSDSKSQLGPETLAGDSTLRQLQGSLLGLPTVRGGPAGNAFTTLAEIGVNVDRYGTMSIDQDRLQKSLDRDASAVTNLLAGTDSTNGVMKKIADGFKIYTDFVDGALPGKQKTIDSRIQILDADIARMEAAATAYETNLRQQFTAMEQLISSLQSQTGALTAQLGLGRSGNG